MESTIKQRIEQINNGQVPEGYKKTDFGVFPCDWVTDKKLKDIGSFDKGRGLPGDKMCDSGVPCVGYGDIYMKYNNFHFEKAKTLLMKIQRVKVCRLKKAHCYLPAREKPQKK